MCVLRYTPKFNIFPKKQPFQKERIVFQTLSILSGAMQLVFWALSSSSHETNVHDGELNPIMFAMIFAN